VFLLFVVVLLPVSLSVGLSPAWPVRLPIHTLRCTTFDSGSQDGTIRGSQGFYSGV